MAFKSLARVLDRDTDLDPIRARLAELRSLQAMLDAAIAAPATAALPRRTTARVCSYAEGVLHLAVDSNAAAALVRQHADRIRRELAAGGVEVNKIKTVVQVGETVVRPLREPVPPLPRERLAEIARTLGEGPLRAVLEKMGRGK